MPADKKRPAKKKAQKVEEGYYLVITVQPAAVLLFGPATDKKVAKQFRNLIKDEVYAESEDIAEVRYLYPNTDLIFETVEPLDNVFGAYVDEDAE